MQSLGRCFLVAVALLAGIWTAQADEPRTKKLLLLAQGPDGHPPATHEYVAGLKVLQKCLEQTPGLDVTLERADEPWEAGPAKLAAADGAVIFLSEGAKWAQAEPRRLDALARLAARGGGFVALHWGMGTTDAAPIDAYLNCWAVATAAPIDAMRWSKRRCARPSRDTRSPRPSGRWPFATNSIFA
jgi:hypothetical protein